MQQAVDVGRTMRFVEHLVRLGLTHRDAEPITKRLLVWRPKDRPWAEVTIAALARELHMRRERVVAILRQLEQLRVLHKVRSWVYRRDLGKKVQATNRYVFRPRPPEFPCRATIIQEKKQEEAREGVRRIARSLADALRGLGAAIGVTTPLEDDTAS